MAAAPFERRSAAPTCPICGSNRFSELRTIDGSLWQTGTDGNLNRDGFSVPGNGPVALHPDGRTWARCLAGEVEIWEDEQLVRSFAGVHRLAPGKATMTGDGQFAAIAAATVGIVVFSIESGKRVQLDDLPQPGRLVHLRGRPELVCITPVLQGFATW